MLLLFSTEWGLSEDFAQVELGVVEARQRLADGLDILAVYT